MTTVTEELGTNTEQDKIVPETTTNATSASHQTEMSGHQGDKIDVLPEEFVWDSLDVSEILILAIVYAAASDSGGENKYVFESFLKETKKNKINEKIEKIYDEIKKLNEKIPADGNSDEFEQILEKKYKELELLQKKEAEQFEQRFRESLEYPMGQGLEVLSKAKEMLENHEDSSSPDQTS